MMDYSENGNHRNESVDTQSGLDVYRDFNRAKPDEPQDSLYSPYPYESFYQPPSPAPYQPPLTKKKRSSFRVAVVALLLVCVMLAGGIGGVAGYLIALQGDNQPGLTDPLLSETPSQGATTDDTPAGGTQAPTQSPDNLLLTQTPNSGSDLSIQEVFAKGTVSTVAIATTSSATNVFGQSVPQASAGSGFIISADGYIMTNYHVIEGATEVTVMLHDGTEYPAEIIGGDALSDIAILKINASGLVAADIGSSSALVVGDQVAAIGNPLGELANTLTVGYISAKEREVYIDEYPRTMLQTDAAVSPGNSGGPLFNLKGQVIGVVSAKTVSSGVEGIGFAIPIDYAVEIANDLITHGYVTGRPYLGITPQDVSTQMAYYYNLPVGIYVNAVESGSPADKAGVEQGDVITEFNGVIVATAADLRAEMYTCSAGDTVELTVSRGGRTRTLTVTLAEQTAG